MLRNLGTMCDEEQLNSLCSLAGTVTEVVLAEDDDDAPCAYVRFRTVTQAQTAISSLHGTKVLQVCACVLVC